jgi:hypothetical protein
MEGYAIHWRSRNNRHSWWLGYARRGDWDYRCVRNRNYRQALQAALDRLQTVQALWATDPRCGEFLPSVRSTARLTEPVRSSAPSCDQTLIAEDAQLRAELAKLSSTSDQLVEANTKLSVLG